MTHEITNAFEKIIDRKLLDAAFNQLSSYVEDNYPHLNLAYNAKAIEIVEHATLTDFELVRTIDITQNDDKLVFKVIVAVEIEIEETVRRDREVESVNKKFILSCSAKIDDIQDSFNVESIEEY